MNNLFKAITFSQEDKIHEMHVSVIVVRKEIQGNFDRRFRSFFSGFRMSFLKKISHIKSFCYEILEQLGRFLLTHGIYLFIHEKNAGKT